MESSLLLGEQDIGSDQRVVHVEVCMTSTSTARVAEVKSSAELFLQAVVGAGGRFLQPNQRWTASNQLNTKSAPSTNSSAELLAFLHNNVSYILVCDVGELRNAVVHVIQLCEDEPVEEFAEDDQVVMCQQWSLPCRELDGLWESLYFDQAIKEQLLKYVYTTLLFSDKGVDTNIISCNRVVLLHGPPGTGKTSLCKALAQKLAIRFSDRYTGATLVEVNAHSLFSKWFSESGKLVLKLFQTIRELIEDQDSFVCVLIDEVESLAAARKSALSGNDPSDSIRVVNALLTQLDQLRHHKNVIILTTSNITGAIDLAFVDRADIKQYIGPPSLRARYEILSSCLYELMRLSIITPSEKLLEFKSLQLLQGAPASPAIRTSQLLLDACQKCEGCSGRALRKYPFLAHALFVQVLLQSPPTTATHAKAALPSLLTHRVRAPQSPSCSADCFIDAIDRIIQREMAASGQLD